MTASWLSGLLMWGENVLELDSGAGCTASHMQHGSIVLCVSHTLKEVSTFTQITAVCELTNSLMLWKGNWVAETE